MRSFVNQFCNMVFRMEGPVKPEVTHADVRKQRKLRREQRYNRNWREAYSQGVIDILNDPAHNKTTE